MFSHSCRHDLTPVPEGGHAPVGAVTYRSDGRILLCGDGEGLGAAGRRLAADRPVLAVAPVADPGGAGTGLHWHRGTVRNLDGRLGAFRATLDDGAEIGADVVIDHGAHALIARDVPPFGYFFTGGDPDRLSAAVEAAHGLKGLFSKPRYFTYTLEICAHENSGQTACTRCLDACGAEAIRSVGWGIEVDPTLCQGCGACTLACPTGALSPAEPGRTALRASLEAAVAARPGERLAIGAVGSGAALEVPAPAAVGEEQWFAALAAGAGGVTLLIAPSEPAATRALVRTRVAIADAMAAALGFRPGTIACEDAEGSVTPATAVGVAQGGVEPPEAVRKRDHLNTALARLDRDPKRPAAPLPEGAPVGGIAIDPDACVLCGICAQACPTAAIRQVETGIAVQIDFAEGNCIQCGLCARLCPEQAIDLVPRLSPAAVRSSWTALNEAPLAACTSCGLRFTPEPLLDAMLRRAAPTAVPGMLDQMRRCPQCRHAGAEGRY